MKTKFQLTVTVLLLSVFALSSTILFGEEEKKIKSLDDVSTLTEVKEYIKSVQNQTPKPEPAKLRQEIVEACLKCGEKIIASSDDKQQQEEGVKLKIYGLKILDQENSTIAQSNKSDGTKNINLENYLNELEKEGKFPDVVNQERYIRLV
ncbi:MAG: hypothetical protein LBJ00_10390 [Planctomycetaceae bacterium]|jgi:hypothetical protein|nr:hypothetical protein [Planctomycetaceae bacterium]